MSNFLKRPGHLRFGNRGKSRVQSFRPRIETLEDRLLLNSSHLPERWPPCICQPHDPQLAHQAQIILGPSLQGSSTSLAKTGLTRSIAALNQPAVVPGAIQASPVEHSTWSIAHGVGLEHLGRRDGGPETQDDLAGFLRRISESAAGQLFSLAGNVFGFANTLYGLFRDDPLDRVIDRINRLEEVIRQGFQDLGSLINTEIERVNENLRTLANQEAIAKALAAEYQLRDYKQYGGEGYVVSAGQLSGEATAFLEQQTDPFYIAGLIAAGSARIDYFRARDPDWVHNPGFLGRG